MVMDGTAVAGAVSGVLATTVKIAEKAYEIRAVDEQARGLLKTVDQVSSQLRDAKSLRRQKSSLFTNVEQRLFDQTFLYTEEALSNVAALVEPARADLEVSGGRVRFKTRVMFVLRDSPRILVCLTQLGIASQSLNRDLVTLCNRDGRMYSERCNITDQAAALKPDLPTYEESMFLSEQRLRNIRRRESALSISTVASAPASYSTPSTRDATAEERPASLLTTPLPRIIVAPEVAQDLSGTSNRPQPTAPSGGGRNRSLRWLESQSR